MRRKPRLLGAVLAGGQSRRFGSDKALALLDGVSLLDHVLARLRPQVDGLIVVGRDDAAGIPDRPSPGLGPLGGLCAALAYAQANGFDMVVTSGCDLPEVPLDLAARLAPGPAVARGQPLFGAWPANLGPDLDRHLATSGDRSLRAWVGSTGARSVDLGTFRNINTPSDLEE